MAKNKDAAFGLLVIVGVIIAILIKVFEFIMDNILIIGILLGAGLSIFAYIKYTDKRDKKEQRERNIQNDNLKDIWENYQKSLTQIDEASKKAILKLGEINKDLDNYKIKALDKSKNLYDPIKAVSRLKNILKKEYFTKNEVWNLISENRKFPHENPKIIFENRIKDIGMPNEPKFFIQKENVSIKRKNDLLIKIEKNKIEYNQSLKSKYDSEIIQITEKIESLLKKLKKKEKEWSTEFQSFENEKNETNNEIESIKSNYHKKEKRAIISYYSKILYSINYDIHFHKSVEIDFNEETKVMIVEYLLPSIEQFPNIKEIRYIKARNEFKEINFSERELINTYDDVIYRIVLDSIYIIFNNDLIDSIESIVFNGWSNAINKATGQYFKACILSVLCEKTEFMKINLAEVDPKECFKSLKGISAPKISSLTAVKPIISSNYNDSRFVSSQEVIIDSSTNLASMHWEDFEHLIREIFEQEFSTNGGAVKVTQSSRDGGVDAIAFDPDPIRGGKIVIQAKRYTNIVSVSSVRDLYGTVLNEGATKGILVTTSDYGSDSFNFAKDKPLTLINGGNLLYLLEKHGYKARINLKEAKESLKQENSKHNRIDGF